jgi:hypothetical protein
VKTTWPDVSILSLQTVPICYRGGETRQGKA